MTTTVEILGLVLAGGASHRMGRDKARLEVAGTPLAAGAVARLAAVCPEVVLADRGRALVPGRRSVADGPGRGPAAGLLGAARAFPGRPLLALACDLPQVPVALLAALAAELPAAGAPPDWIVPRWRGGPEPLCALWGPGALAALEERVAHGSYALQPLAATAGLAVRWLDAGWLAAFGDPAEMFLNVNTPQDLDRAQGRRGAVTPEPG